MKIFINRLFSFAFRPFFLLGVIFSTSAIIVWLLVWNGCLLLNWSRAPVHWHAHDMMMGLMAAAIAGFVLTAIANWTSRPAVAGWPLAILVVFWIAGRLAMLSPVLSALADALFWLVLCVLVARELFSVRNQRNYKVLALLLMLSFTDMLFHAGELQLLPLVDLQRTLHAQLWMVIILINVIGGRVIPTFTGNWLRRQAPKGAELGPSGLPGAFGLVDQFAIGLLLLFVASVILQLPAAVAMLLGFCCFVAQAWRLLRWKFWLTLSDPLVWMMHLSYAWLVAGILLWTLSLAGIVPNTAAVHALTIGAITSMIISVGARAALGHTGRVLESHYLLTASIILLSLAALARIATSMAGGSYWLEVAAGLWLSALLCFALRYVPILVGPVK